MTNPVLDQERAAFIRARLGNSPGSAFLPPWPRQKKELAVAELEVDWIRFSVLNHRTRAEQLSEQQRRSRADLFSRDPLGPDAQDAQFRILKSQEGFGALKADLMQRGQQDPGVVTADGVLINGNRRAAALRSLYLEDNHFGARYIRCLVLPDDATQSEIIDLETELQIARDFKEKYSWVNEAILIEELYEREGRNFDRVAEKMHMQPVFVRAQYEKLQQLNQLLELSNGNYLHIDFVENESAFEELAKYIRSKSREEGKGVKAAYYLGTLTGVNYRDLRELRRPDATDLIERELLLDPALQPLLDLARRNVPTGGPRQDPLDDVLGPESEEGVVQAVLSVIAGKRPSQVLQLPDGQEVLVEQLHASIRDKIAIAAMESKEEQRDQAAVGAPIHRLSAALADIQRAATTLPRARSYSEWEEEAFTEKLRQVRLALDELEKCV